MPSRENVAQEEPDVKIQYSVSDSDGNQPTKEQQDYFKDSQMRDADGNLKVMYHGSPNGGLRVFTPRSECRVLRITMSGKSSKYT